jgi:phosphatidylglycerol lysyltransferase
LPVSVLSDLRRVSDGWLQIPGHRERQFTLGSFEPWYVQSTTVYAASDLSGRIVAFANLVPSYDPALATVDLMRRSSDNVNGVMDFLFAKMFLDLKDRGFLRFGLGMAPLASPDTTSGEIARWLLNRMPSLFRADSLRRFKAKYADDWTPRYSVYQSRLDLPRLALAIRRVSELSPALREAA